MEYRKLGKTGLRVSLIGFGGIPIQNISEALAYKVINIAIDKGINFFDTARRYTDSEEKIGKALGQRRSQVIIASKSRVYTKKEMEADIEASLRALKTSKIDLYQIHNVRTKDDLKMALSKNGALAALKDAKKKGLIGHIGITGHIPSLLLEGMETREFDTVQVIYNALEQYAQDVIDMANVLNMGIIVMKPLGGGAFRDISPEALKFICGKEVSTVIPGMGSVEEVLQNAVIGDSYSMSDIEKANLMKAADSLEKNFCRRCRYCLPCPEGIDIPEIFIIKGYLDRYKMRQHANVRYDNLAKKANDCTKCGLCEKECPFGLPIREMLAEADLLFSRKE